MNISPVPCAPRPQYFFGVQLCCPSHYQGKSSDLWALIRPGLCGFWPRPDPETHLQVQRPWNQNRQGPHFGIVRYFVQTDLMFNIFVMISKRDTSAWAHLFSMRSTASFHLSMAFCLSSWRVRNSAAVLSSATSDILLAVAASSSFSLSRAAFSRSFSNRKLIDLIRDKSAS